MGYRLDGKILDSVKNLSIISAGVIPGTIQVPPSGYPIVLMADSPCTGGYPRFAVVHPEDIGSLAQILPGEDVKFIWCYDQDKGCKPKHIQDVQELINQNFGYGYAELKCLIGPGVTSFVALFKQKVVGFCSAVEKRTILCWI